MRRTKKKSIHGIYAKDINGTVSLFKNKKMIRNSTFNNIYKRKALINQWLSDIKTLDNTKNEYYLTIKINI